MRLADILVVIEKQCQALQEREGIAVDFIDPVLCPGMTGRFYDDVTTYCVALYSPEEEKERKYYCHISLNAGAYVRSGGKSFVIDDVQSIPRQFADTLASVKRSVLADMNEMMREILDLKHRNIF